MNTIRAWAALGPWHLLLRTVVAGALAGVLSWALVFIVRRSYPDIREPTGSLLVTAILRGVVVGGAVGLVLYLYWARRAS